LTRGVVLRAVGLALAIALGAIGVWLVATGDTPKRIQLGVLAGFWGLLIGAFAMFGSRRPAAAAEAEQPGAAPMSSMAPGAAVELRSTATGLERAEEAARRREHEERLERLVRHEIQATVSREVAQLRSEIAHLRGELLDKVGGQLRLERIETTRVIGSDLEALQHEVRELKRAAREADDLAVSRARLTETTGTFRPIVEPARVRPVSRQTAEVEADVQPARLRPEPELRAEPPLRVEPRFRSGPELRSDPAYRVDALRPAVEQTAPIPITSVEPPSAQPPAAPPSTQPRTPVQPPAAPPSAQPRRAGEPPAAAAQPRTAAQPPAAPAGPATPVILPPPAPPQAPANPPEPGPSADPFAGLPRIRPFTDFELDPIEEEPRYTGRRRRTEESERGGRHARPAPEEPEGRRRAPEDGSELLAKLLARESSRR
jgi:hypothetical protein